MIWTDAELELAGLYYKSALTDEEYKRKTGRTRIAYKEKLRWLKYREQILAGRKQEKQESCSSITSFSFVKPSPQQLEDAAYRCSLRTPIGDILGDPAPGYSALDKRVSS